MLRKQILTIVSSLDGLIVANLGFPSRELYELGDQPNFFYMLGSMGLASSIGLGLAFSQKKMVYVLDGDGSLLMNLGSLATIAHHAPPHYNLIILDNGVYGSTGNQATYSNGNTDLLRIARGAGNSFVQHVSTTGQFIDALSIDINSAKIIVAATETGNENVPVIPLEPLMIAERFMQAVAD